MGNFQNFEECVEGHNVGQTSTNRRFLWKKWNVLKINGDDGNWQKSRPADNEIYMMETILTKFDYNYTVDYQAHTFN